MITPQQLDFPSLAFPKDRTALYVSEVAKKLQISEQHVIDLIAEGKIAAIDISGRQNYVPVPMDAIEDIARRLGMGKDTLLNLIRSHKAKGGAGRAHWRIPVESFHRYLVENCSMDGVK